MKAITRACLIASAAALAIAPAARAQRDTIRLGAPRDTVTLTAADTTRSAPARDPRWATPFAVESSGQAVPRREPRDVVWLDADSVRARRRAARLAAAGDSAAADSAAAEAPADSSETADSAEAPPPPRPRRAAADSAAAPRRTRTAARDTASATPRRTRTTPRETADSATTPRRTRTAASDTATTRRTATTARPRTHRVVEGETLFGIARRYGVTTAQLRALNPDLVVGELATGTVLRLPAGARASGDTSSDDGDRAEAPRRAATTERTQTPPARRAATETRPATRGRRTHTVAAHETLYGIARKYGVTVDAIKAANRLTSDTVRPGQTLTIPAAAAPR